MKSFFIIIALFVITLSAHSQTVDTSANVNRVSFVFSLSQQRLFQSVLGDNWKQAFIDNAMRLSLMVRQSDDVERALIKAQRDSIQWHRSEIERLKREALK